MNASQPSYVSPLLPPSSPAEHTALESQGDPGVRVLVKTRQVQL